MQGALGGVQASPSFPLYLRSKEEPIQETSEDTRMYSPALSHKPSMFSCFRTQKSFPEAPLFNKVVSLSRTHWLCSLAVVKRKQLAAELALP